MAYNTICTLTKLARRKQDFNDIQIYLQIFDDGISQGGVN